MYWHFPLRLQLAPAGEAEEFRSGNFPFGLHPLIALCSWGWAVKTAHLNCSLLKNSFLCLLVITRRNYHKQYVYYTSKGVTVDFEGFRSIFVLEALWQSSDLFARPQPQDLRGSQGHLQVVSGSFRALKHFMKSNVDPMVPWYGPRMPNPYKAVRTLLYSTFKTGAHSSERVKEGIGPY